MTFLYRRNVPLLHTSRYVIAHDQFYQAFPYVSTAKDKHWVRRPGYEATSNPDLLIPVLFACSMCRGCCACSVVSAASDKHLGKKAWV